MQIKDSITLTLNNTYLIKDFQCELIKKCIIDNPNDNMVELGIKLGISERTLYRLLTEHKINLKLLRKQNMLKITVMR